MAPKTTSLTAGADQANNAKRKQIKGTQTMKNTLKTLVISASAIFAISTIFGATPGQQGQSCCGDMMAMQTGSKTDKSATAKQSKKVQKATITINNGYSPSSIKVKHGIPVELTYVGGKNIGCGGTVVFKSLKIRS